MDSPGSSSSDFDAAATFAASLMDQINKEDVNNMVSTQKDMLSRFEKTNEMLINFNILSANRFAVTSQEFKKHTQLMYEMKKDLDSIFKRIRTIKTRLGKSYPEAFNACQTEPLLEDDEEEEMKEEGAMSRNHSSSSQSSSSENRSKTSQSQASSSGNETQPKSKIETDTKQNRKPKSRTISRSDSHRKSGEKDRKSGEKDRKSAEKDRKTSEKDRKRQGSKDDSMR